MFQRTKIFSELDTSGVIFANIENDMLCNHELLSIVSTLMLWVHLKVCAKIYFELQVIIKIDVEV